MQRRQVLKVAGSASMVGVAGFSGCLGTLTGDDGGEYPSETITNIVPYGEGGSTDVYSRKILPVVGDELGVDFQIDNIEGASGMRGVGQGHRADPDGYTMTALNPPFEMITALVQEPDFDMTEMEAVCTYGAVSWTVGVNAESDVETFDDLKAEFESGDFQNFGSVGLQADIIASVLRDDFDLQWENIVQYDGSGPLGQALASGEISAGTITETSAQPLVEDDRIKVIMALTSRGSEIFPDLPTPDEAGYSNIDWIGQLAKSQFMPPDTSSEKIATLNEGIEAAINSNELQEWSEETGNTIYFEGPETAQELMDNAFEEIPNAIDIEEYR